MASQATDGEIRRDSVYPLNEFRRRLGLTPSALRSATREGLRVDRVGKRGFVRGEEWLEFLRRRAEERMDSLGL